LLNHVDPVWKNENEVIFTPLNSMSLALEMVLSLWGQLPRPPRLSESDGGQAAAMKTLKSLFSWLACDELSRIEATPATS
jgi:hypothetical protein